MFKKTINETQLDIFCGVHAMLHPQSQKHFDDTKAWHNQFRAQIYNRINEDTFSKLYSDKMGAGNASIRLLISMMILKEGMGWSDIQLYEQCRFNLLVRSALSLFNLNDKLPAMSTYYLLRQKIHAHFVATDEELFAQCFHQVTQEQIQEFQVSGKAIRMDSKLIGSNIANYSRYEIIHKTLKLFINKLPSSQLQVIPGQGYQQLDHFLSEDPEKVVYYHTSEEITARLKALGVWVHTLLKTRLDAPDEVYKLLERVFYDHYQVQEDQEIALLPKQKIASDSVQSPHDPDCSYRQKGDQKVKGYAVNLTETISGKGLHLITHAKVAKANVQDSTFLAEAITQTQKLTGQKVEKLHADGNYHSPLNKLYTRDLDMVMTGIQGGKPRYALEMKAEGLYVTDTRTGEGIFATPVKGSGKKRWRIKNEKGAYRYFDAKDLQTYKLRQECENRSLQDTRNRNNVEATIRHLVCALTKSKTPYRRLGRQVQWVMSRCLWINLRRIIGYNDDTGISPSGSTENMAFPLVTMVKNSFFYRLLEGIADFLEKFLQPNPKKEFLVRI